MRLRRMTFLPYLSALATACLGGAFNPRGWTLIFTHALPAASAAFGLTQMDHFPRAISHDSVVQPAGRITRSYKWIAAASLALAFFVGVLGPGLRFNHTPCSQPPDLILANHKPVLVLFAIDREFSGGLRYAMKVDSWHKGRLRS